MSDGESDPAGADPIRNPEAVLVTAGALEEGEDDLVLTGEFRTAWREEVADVKSSDAQREEIAEVLGLDGGEVSFEVFQEAFRIRVDGSLVGMLESQAAFYADLAAARLLADRVEGWTELGVGGRSRLLKGLRLFLEQCPDCGHEVAFDTERVESCCGEHTVAAVDCGQCGSRLFESAPLGT